MRSTPVHALRAFFAPSLPLAAPPRPSSCTKRGVTTHPSASQNADSTSDAAPPAAAPTAVPGPAPVASPPPPRSGQEAARRPTAAAPGEAFYDARSRNISPMLAQNALRLPHLLADPEAAFFLSYKLDGVRTVAYFDPVAKRVMFRSRNGLPFECTDWIEPEVRPLFERDPTLVLDGEIYHEDADHFGQIIGSIRATRSRRTKEHAEMQKQLKFFVFDIMYANNISPATPFVRRLLVLERLKATLAEADTSQRIVFLDHMKIPSKLVHRLAAKAVDQGYEGIMLREPNGTYTCGSRSIGLIKVKQMQDAEFRVTKVLEGDGKFRGAVGAIVLTTGGNAPKTFKATFGIPDSDRRHYWKNPDTIVGKMVTIEFQELTERGVPRFGRFKAIRGQSSSGSDFV